MFCCDTKRNLHCLVGRIIVLLKILIMNTCQRKKERNLSNSLVDLIIQVKYLILLTMSFPLEFHLDAFFVFDLLLLKPSQDFNMTGAVQRVMLLNHNS